MCVCFMKGYTKGIGVGDDCQPHLLPNSNGMLSFYPRIILFLESYLFVNFIRLAYSPSTLLQLSDTSIRTLKSELNHMIEIKSNQMPNLESWE